ncbi:hypothetical protein [Jiangella muralis]|uniref:hypothetical protein n=1 Tax=Jiangella muralis TaxID=702383 RepID=UPI00069F8F91|nr:hypothetical protein [Jiangella muralis]
MTRDNLTINITDGGEPEQPSAAPPCAWPRCGWGCNHGRPIETGDEGGVEGDSVREFAAYLDGLASPPHARPVASLSGLDLGHRVVLAVEPTPPLTGEPTVHCGQLDRVEHWPDDRTWVVLDGNPIPVVRGRALVSVAP